MPLAFYICAGISALFIIFALAQIISHLSDLREIHLDLCRIHTDMERSIEWFLKWSGEKERLLKLSGAEESKPTKKREYWRDQNGFRHWRKKKDA